MDNSNEDFWVQYYDGSTWHTVATYARGIDFDNNVFYVSTVTILEANYNFPTNMKIRFMCDASGNRDDVYIDDIRITASATVTSSNNTIVMVEDMNMYKTFPEEMEEGDIMVYPNPATDKIRLSVTGAEEGEVYIYSSTGQLMFEGREMDLSESINVSNFEKGLYIIKIIAGGELHTSKLIKQ